MQLGMKQKLPSFFGIRDCRRKHILIVIVIVPRERERGEGSRTTRNSNQIAFGKSGFLISHLSDGNQSENSPKKGRFACFCPEFCSHFLRCVFVLQEGEIKMHLTSVVRFGFGRACLVSAP